MTLPGDGLARRRCLGLLAAAAPVVLAGCGAGSAVAGNGAQRGRLRPPPGRPGAVPDWLLTRSALAQVSGNTAVRAGLGRSRVYEILQPGQRPQGLVGARPAVIFASAARLTDAIRSGDLPASTAAVVYDPEVWAFTPASEQRDPVAATARAAQAAHARGLQLIVTPALDLVTVLAPTSRAPRWRRFLDLDLAADLAARADVLELQAQSLERNVTEYSAFVTAAARQARHASPQVGLLAGLSTNPPGGVVTAAAVIAAWRATRDVADGFWLNIPGAGAQCPACNAVQPGIGIQALLAAFQAEPS